MRIFLDFINTHDRNELMIAAFYLAVVGTAIGWVVDFVMQERGFGVVGNGILIFLGAIVGAIVAQMNGPFATIGETNRIVLFSASASALVLVICAIIKGRLSVT